jgi:predicted metalloprotease with PDZ domain
MKQLHRQPWERMPRKAWRECERVRGPLRQAQRRLSAAFSGSQANQQTPLRMTRAGLLVTILAPILAVLAIASSACAQPSAVAYTITLVAPEQHLVEIQVALPEGPDQRELQLPVWNALYQIRDFAQYINWVRAKDRAGHAIAVRQLDKSRWQITGTRDGVLVEYQMFVDSPGPFGAQFNSHHAFFNLAEILMYPADARDSPMAVTFSHVAAEWQVATPLTRLPDGRFSAESYDRLVDSPVEIGGFHESDFDEGGGHYRVVVDAEAGDYDMQTIVVQLRKIVAAATGWMEDRPFETYLFLYHFPHGPAGGGMEHAYATAIDVSAEVVKKNSAAVPGVTAHEFFHLWNVKRIRPQTLQPVDYTKENYTRALWFSEGVTSTAEGTIQLRAGLLDEKAYIYRLGEEITELERRPAHLTQSAEESSLDAWLEGNAYYRRPERSISYYNKGELLGIMLDLAIREASHGRASLREMMQWMNQNYARKGRYFKDSEGVREAAEAVCHADLGWFFTNYVAGKEEIPWNTFLRTVGLRVVEGLNTEADPGFTASRNFDGPMVITAVSPAGEAEKAGLQAGDTILEIHGKPAGQELRQALSRMNPGDTITLKVRGRRSGERELKWKLGSRQEISYQVKDLDSVTAEQRARRAAWLKGDAQSAEPAKPGAAELEPDSPGVTKIVVTSTGVIKN